VSHAGAPALNAPLIVGHIQHFSLAQLTPDPHNARTHAPAQIQKIAASMREFGFVNPILIAADHRIIAGHARWQAAQQLGLPQVPVIVLDHLTPAPRDCRSAASDPDQLGENLRMGLLQRSKHLV
jgi:hypothetical protein